MKRFLLGLCLVCFFSSCYHVYYSPNTNNAPLLSEKNEFKVNALVGGGAATSILALELQSAYALTNNIGLMVNGFKGSKKSEENFNIRRAHLNYIEFAPGFFKGIDKEKKFISEIYAGYGIGNVRNYYLMNDYSRSGIKKIFFQSAIGYKKRNIELILVPKLSFIKLNIKEDRILHSDNSKEKERVEEIKKNPNLTSFEPSFILRGGSEKLKFQFAITASGGRGYLFFTDIFETTLASIGFSINLRSKKK